MEIKVATIIEIAFLALLLFAYFKVSYTGRVTTFTKWLLALSSIGVLFFADKIKLSLWLICVGAIWLIKYKKKNNESA